MNVLLILDKDLKTKLSKDFESKIVKAMEGKGYPVEIFQPGKNDIFHCIGCFLCLTKHPGECVNKDVVNEIRRNVKKYSSTLFLTPVLFGHYSSTMASAINKGTGSHNWQVIIGFGEDIDEEERSTFIDLTAKHRGKADIVHPGMDRQVDVFVSRSLRDNDKICEILEKQCEFMM